MTGSIGVSPGTSIKGCEAQAGTTYITCKGLATTTELSGTAALSGTLKPNAAGKKAQFIFKVGTAFSTTSVSKVTLTNGAKACNVFWCVGSSAAIAGLNVVNGPLIAYTSVSVGEATMDAGGFFALNGAVTLLNDKITKSRTTC